MGRNESECHASKELAARRRRLPGTDRNRNSATGRIRPMRRSQLARPRQLTTCGRPRGQHTTWRPRRRRWEAAVAPAKHCERADDKSPGYETAGFENRTARDPAGSAGRGRDHRRTPRERCAAISAEGQQCRRRPRKRTRRWRASACRTRIMTRPASTLNPRSPTAGRRPSCSFTTTAAATSSRTIRRPPVLVS